MNKIELTFFQNNLGKLVLEKNKKLESVINWLRDILNSSNFDSEILMPAKYDLAQILHVGLGTVQNAYRFLEDEGILISKQRIGTFYIPAGKDVEIRKLTSKKDRFINEFKSYILDSGLKVGDKLKSVRFYSKKMNISTALVIQILNQLELQGILINKDGIRYLVSVNFQSEMIVQSSLVDKVYVDLKKFIFENYKVGDKISTVIDLSKMFNVSSKTIHSAIKLLEKDGILKPRFGRYGTVVLKIPNDNIFYQKPETSIFAPSSQTYVYHYEKILNIIRKMIYDNFGVGSKLPSISELSMLLDVNPNTIRKCFDVLKSDGVVTSMRGRYGGTFVIEIPEFEAVQTYQWLAVNTEF